MSGNIALLLRNDVARLLCRPRTDIRFGREEGVPPWYRQTITGASVTDPPVSVRRLDLIALVVPRWEVVL